MLISVHDASGFALVPLIPLVLCVLGEFLAGERNLNGADAENPR